MRTVPIDFIVTMYPKYCFLLVHYAELYQTNATLDNYDIVCFVLQTVNDIHKLDDIISMHSNKLK